MNESQFRERWAAEKEIHAAWGGFVVAKINALLEAQGKVLGSFLKIPASCRLKDDESLVDKAFYRKKKYDDPYCQIEDKVGARFVVLLLDDIKLVCSVIESCDAWSYDACKHFEKDREKDPLLFSYQSVHYILRPQSGSNFEGVSFSQETPCEVQIRTLLQHAHAELTHDAIYKSKKEVKPKVHRTVAKSIALIETADDFFSEASRLLNFGPVQEFQVVEQLDAVYRSFVGGEPSSQKSSLVLWDEYEDVVDKDVVSKIASVTSKWPHLQDAIRNRCGENALFRQSVVLFVYWMLWRHKRRLINGWPFPLDVLDLFANDIGVSLRE